MGNFRGKEVKKLSRQNNLLIKNIGHCSIQKYLTKKGEKNDKKS